jgi:ATP-dependent RNA helicase RhlE
MPKEIARLAAEILRDPVEVAVAPVATTVERVVQQVFFVNDSGKRDLLVELLRRPDFQRTIVFTRTKRGADRVSQHLAAAGISATAIHGNKSQPQRQRALDGFRAGRSSVLVATDIAARGIDVDDVSHVVNYELPEVAEAYVHRIGRTARAGAEGMAVSLCDDSERGLLRAIEKLTRQVLPATDRRVPGSREVPRSKPQQARPHRSAGAHQPQAKRKEGAGQGFGGRHKQKERQRFGGPSSRAG